ncbi:organic solute transporter subunit alpha-like [Styela clava]
MVDTTAEIMTTDSMQESQCLYGPQDRAPNSSEVIQQIADMGTGAYVYMMVPVVLFTALSIIYVEEAVFLIQNTDFWRRTQHKLWILSAFPVIAGLCVVGLFFPRSSPTIQILISFYNALCMKKYADLVLHYYGGKKKMAEICNEMKVIPYAFPCFMWFCFPKIVMNVRNIRIMQYLIYPVTVYQPIVFFILTVLWNEDLGGTSIAPLLTVLNLSVPLASFVAVYGFVIMNKASERPLRNFRIRGKFVTVQLILGINTVQGVILLLMDRFRAVPCTFPYQSPRPGFMLHLYIFPMELFLLSVAARFVFRVSEVGILPIPEPRDDFDEIKVDDGEEIDAVAPHSKRRVDCDGDSDYRSSSDRHSSVNSGTAGNLTKKPYEITSDVASDTSSNSVRLKLYNKSASHNTPTDYMHNTSI